MLASCLGVLALTAQVPAGFYSTIDPVQVAQTTNGTLLRWEAMPGAPDGATAYRVLYRAENRDSKAEAVSGVVIVPAGNPPLNGRPVVAWAHPTTGIEPKCAPSKARVLYQSIKGLRDMLNRGYIIAATDYPGLGTSATTHPFLVGVSEAKSVLDSVRAAHQVPGAHASKEFALWGHSQGGHAVLFAGGLAHRYAPELHLAGVAAAAPATDLAALFEADIATNGGRNLTAMTLWSWSRVYGIPMPATVTARGSESVDRIASGCIETVFDIIERRGLSRDLAQHFTVGNEFLTSLPWRDRLAENTPGPLPESIPLFLAQGEKDGLVRPEITRAYAKRQCDAGGSVQLHSMPNGGHAFAARDSAKAATQWIAARFAGVRATPSACRP